MSGAKGQEKVKKQAGRQNLAADQRGKATKLQQVQDNRDPAACDYD